MGSSGDCQEANERLTAPRSGIYHISGALNWFADGIHHLTGDRYLNLKKNGSTYLATESRAGRRDDIHEVSTIARLSQGDYITVTAYQTTGAP